MKSERDNDGAEETPSSAPTGRRHHEQRFRLGRTGRRPTERTRRGGPLQVQRDAMAARFAYRHGLRGEGQRRAPDPLPNRREPGRSAEHQGRQGDREPLPARRDGPARLALDVAREVPYPDDRREQAPAVADEG